MALSGGLHESLELVRGPSVSSVRLNCVNKGTAECVNAELLGF